MRSAGFTHQRTSQASAPSRAVEVLSDDIRVNPRNVTDESEKSSEGRRIIDPETRRVAENFSRAANVNNQTQANSNQDSNGASGKNALENIIGKVRAAVDKFGDTSIKWAGGFALGLYLIGWKIPATFIAVIGVGGGYLLKTKLAKVGEEPNHDQQIVDAIKAKKLPKELEVEILKFLEQRLAADAYKNSNGYNQWSDLGSQAAKATQAARNVASRVANSFNNQPSTTQPA
ncbi:MAG: hypothetical protein ACOYK1_01460 [Vampirovibrionia bacterium]